jgi:hypothetical protein
MGGVAVAVAADILIKLIVNAQILDAYLNKPIIDFNFFTILGAKEKRKELFKYELQTIN